MLECDECLKNLHQAYERILINLPAHIKQYLGRSLRQGLHPADNDDGKLCFEGPLSAPECQGASLGSSLEHFGRQQPRGEHRSCHSNYQHDEELIQQ